MESYSGGDGPLLKSFNAFNRVFVLDNKESEPEMDTNNIIQSQSIIW